MAKPVDPGRFATDVGAAVAPSEAKKNVGWVPGEKPPAGFLNWLANTAYLWFNWLLVELEPYLAGLAWSWTGAHSFSQNISAPGGISLGAGDLTGTANSAVSLSGAGALIECTAGSVSTSIGSTGITTTGDVVLTGTGGDVVVEQGNITANVGNVVATAGYVKTAEADIRHANRTVNIHALDHVGPGFTADFTAGAGFMKSAAAADKLVIPFELQAGERLRQVTLFVRDTASTMTLELKKIDLLASPSGTPTTFGGPATSLGSGADQTLEITGATEVVGAAELIYALVTAGATGHRVYGGYYIVDRL